MATEAQVHIVTGKRPEDHISSANAGNFNAGVVGVGSYIMNVGKKLAASLGSNAVTIAEGTAVHNGRQIDVEAPVTLTIDAGSSGQKRNDLIVIRYTKDSGGVEDAKLMVIKGTPTTATPTDPAYNKGSVLDGVSTSDMVLYRVQLDGVTVKTPVAVAKMMAIPVENGGTGASSAEGARKALKIYSGQSTVSVTFSDHWGTATVNLGTTLPNSDYDLIVTLRRDGAYGSECVKKKTASSFDLYVETTGSFQRESFTVEWLAICKG